MGPWLSATIKQDLDQALEVTRSQLLGSPDATFGDDGSKLQVKASKPGVVQIIKWEHNDDPSTAWISDSTVRIKAIFAPKAATQHERKTGKRITNETVGNIIQLEDADIIALYNHAGPRTRKITLLINKFKVIGSDTTGQIGNSRPFDNIAEFDELLRKLDTFGALKDNTHSVPAAQGTPEKIPGAAARPGSFVPINLDQCASQQLFSQVLPHHDSSNAAAITIPQPLGASRPSGWAHAQTDKIIELLEAKRATSAPTKPATDNTSPVAGFLPSKQNSPVPLAQSGPVETETLINPLKPEYRVQKKIRQRKIRSRDLRISKDQQDLLESEDSWLPAKPGRRDPVANLPPATLEEITTSLKNKFAEHDSAEEEEEEEEDDTADDISEEIDEPLVERQLEGTAETQPEISISAQDWPTSPPVSTQRRERKRDMLPADNAPAIADDTDLESDSEVRSGAGSPIRAPSSEYQNEQAQVPRSTPTESKDSVDGKLEVISIGSTDSDEDGQGNIVASGVDPSENESDPEELETSVLLKLDELYTPISEPSHTQEVPATAIQPHDAYLQVKRTPYGGFNYGEPVCTDSQPYPATDRFSSPSKRRRTDESGRAQNAEDHEDQIHMSSVDSARIHDHGSSGTHLSQVPNSGVEETWLEHSTQHGVPSTRGSREPVAAAITSEAAPNSLDSQEETGPSSRHAMRPPYVSKRRKLHKASINFGFSQDEIPNEDPSVAARRYREEYMARRKMSYPESHTSPNNEASKTERGKHAQTTTPEQSKMIVGEVAPSLHTWGAADNPDPSLGRPGVSQDDIHRSNQSPEQHADATSSEGAAAPLNLVKSPAVISEATSSPEPASLVDPTSQGPMTAKFEKPHPVIEHSDVHSSLQSVSTKLEAISSTEISQQSNLIGQAQSLPELMTPALSHTDLPDISIVAQNTRVQPAIYLRFQSAYPEYRGSQEDFLGMCRKIEQLFRCDRMEHKSLWDDFVMRYQVDYPQYLERCVKNFGDPKTYERFYRDEIDEPKFTKRVLLPSTLGEAVPLGSVSYVAPGYSSVDEWATRGSPITKPGVQPTLPSRGMTRPEHFFDALAETSQHIAETSPRSPQFQEDWYHMRHSEDHLGRSPVKRHESQIDVPKTARRDDAVPSSSSSASPPPVETSMVAKGSVSRSPRRLPWLRDAAAASKESSKRNSPVDHYSRKQLSKRPLSTTDPSKDKSRSTSRRTASKHKKNVTSHSQKAVPRPLRPVLLEHLHTAKTRHMDMPPEDSDPSEPKVSPVDVQNIDEGLEDHPTSLRGFTKFYQAIRPGRGNSWAHPEDRKSTSPRKVESKGGGASETKTINVMSWRL
ncbi:MAG: hypothetical protein Q9169_003125 [Polycauliona sp. 2 TL-2023]